MEGNVPLEVVLRATSSGLDALRSSRSKMVVLDMSESISICCRGLGVPVAFGMEKRNVEESAGSALVNKLPCGTLKSKSESDMPEKHLKLDTPFAGRNPGYDDCTVFVGFVGFAGAEDTRDCLDAEGFVTSASRGTC